MDYINIIEHLVAKLITTDGKVEWLQKQLC